ncbi:disulfide bond formation protein B [Hylemonella gracilis]|uniref:disulfide bond formation protein B n=1 Tax=Hylemonella gracilis TaxID=80880 RepID=UPI001E64466C|nr:disulfide bond formation protein B [Hylemonella gracilis]
MLRQLCDVLNAPRRILFLIFLACLGLLAFGLYLQHGVGLEPCPMCIVQRYALLLVAIFAGSTAWLRGRTRHLVGGWLVLLSAVLGAFVAARQSWLQWHPPEILSCGRDFYGMIEAFPLQRAVPMIFRGSGDCAAIDWTFLGLSIANWSFVCFALIAFVATGLLSRLMMKHT